MCKILVNTISRLIRQFCRTIRMKWNWLPKINNDEFQIALFSSRNFWRGLESRSVVGSIYLSYIRTFSIMWMSAVHVRCSMCYHFKQIHTSTNFYCQWIESQSSISMGLTSWSFAPHFPPLFFLNGIRWRIEFVSCISLIWALSHLDWISVNCNCFFIWMILPRSELSAQCEIISRH